MYYLPNCHKGREKKGWHRPAKLLIMGK